MTRPLFAAGLLAGLLAGLAAAAPADPAAARARAALALAAARHDAPPPEAVAKIMASRVVSGGGEVLEDVHVHIFLVRSFVAPPGGEVRPWRSFAMSAHPIRLDGVAWDAPNSWWDEPQHELLQWSSLHSPFVVAWAADGAVEFTALRGAEREAEVARLNAIFPRAGAPWRPLSDQWGLLTLAEQRALNRRLSGAGKGPPAADPRAIPRQGGGPIPDRPGPPAGRKPIPVPLCPDCRPPAD